jgi:hypothetical protein
MTRAAYVAALVATLATSVATQAETPFERPTAEFVPKLLASMGCDDIKINPTGSGGIVYEWRSWAGSFKAPGSRVEPSRLMSTQGSSAVGCEAAVVSS